MAGKQINIRLEEADYEHLVELAAANKVTAAQMAKGMISGALGAPGTWLEEKPEDQESPATSPPRNPETTLPTERQPETLASSVTPEPSEADARDAEVLKHFAEQMDDAAAVARDQSGENVVSVELSGVAYMARVLSQMLTK